ncbi:MAG: UbiA family prenyltransferase [Ferruginibacter sp.]
MLKFSTIQLLRFHFSFFLMPVFWFAISQVKDIDTQDALLVFFILHFLVYPSSNGYNSYMDRDTESIGGIKSPVQPTLQLFYVSVVLDVLALLLSLLISNFFCAGIFLYIIASRAYSYRGIRLKKYPVTGYIIVLLCQGALTFFLVMHGSSVSKSLQVSPTALTGAALLIGGFYPLTQIYQHMQDLKDGVTTISYKLGYRGTFIFTAAIYLMAISAIGIYMYEEGNVNQFVILQIFLLPVLVYFCWWFYKVYKDTRSADFKNTMRMNLIASFFTNAAFIFIFLIKKI